MVTFYTNEWFQIDVNGDGHISLFEFKTMMELLMKSSQEDERQLVEETFEVRDMKN